MFVFRLFVVCNLKVIKIKWKIMLDLATYQEFFVCWRTHICIITRFVGVAIIIVITDRSASFLWTCWSSNDGICIWKNIDSSRCRVCWEGLCKNALWVVWGEGLLILAVCLVYGSYMYGTLEKFTNIIWNSIFPNI